MFPNTTEQPLTCKNTRNTFPAILSPKNEEKIMPRIKVEGSRCEDGEALQVAVRPDRRHPGRAFIAAPAAFTAKPDKLRELADAMHDVADELEQQHG